MTYTQAKASATADARKTGRNQLIIKKNQARHTDSPASIDNDYIAFARSDGTIGTCERLVKALGAEIVDEINVLK